ncbi:hypothetical protein Rhopal_006646-T1 [Rhodotorula paludigena]|uniref:HSF-type DNA-binding domain-containing protein n=1 Tax=Rhodotorula paludigena TaxID=86838 RepID=A0AAV5GWN0_9BASI|nr:hypothetical protein Rhopal_006646-T1 [Rhodotorula paludigena]
MRPALATDAPYADYSIAPSPGLSGGSKSASGGSTSPTTPVLAQLPNPFGTSGLFGGQGVAKSPAFAHSAAARPAFEQTRGRLPSLDAPDESALEAAAAVAAASSFIYAPSRPSPRPQSPYSFPAPTGLVMPMTSSAPSPFAVAHHQYASQSPRYNYERKRSIAPAVGAVESTQEPTVLSAPSPGLAALLASASAIGGNDSSYPLVDQLAAAQSSSEVARALHELPSAADATRSNGVAVPPIKDEEDAEADESEPDDQKDEDYVDGPVAPIEKRSQHRSSNTAAPTTIPIAGSTSSAVALNPSILAQPANDAVTPFISNRSISIELHHLLNNATYSDVIRYNADGTAILYAHGSKRLLSILGSFFRHTSVTSLARQLNIYGFKRESVGELLVELDRAFGPVASTSSDLAFSAASIPVASPAPIAPGAMPSASDWSGFSHPLFWRDQPGRAVCDLTKLKPQGPKTERGRANLAKKIAEGGKKRKKKGGADGGKVGGVRKGGFEE